MLFRNQVLEIRPSQALPRSAGNAIDARRCFDFHLIAAATFADEVSAAPASQTDVKLRDAVARFWQSRGRRVSLFNPVPI
jgi:hypothetical protein